MHIWNSLRAYVVWVFGGSGAPPGVKNLLHPFIIAFVAVNAVLVLPFVVMLAVFVALTAFGDGWARDVLERQLLVATPIGLVPVLMTILGRRALRSRIVPFIRKHNGCVCLQCGYPLVGLSPEHYCPECGVAYDDRLTKASWFRWLDSIGVDSMP